MKDQLNHFVINSRLLDLAEQLSAGCDPDFDAQHEELEREFQELRFQLCHIE